MASLQKVLCLLCVLLVLFVVVLYPLFLLTSLVSSYLTVPVTVLLLLGLLVLCFRTLIQMLIFPGSFVLWKRSLESHYCKEMSSQLLQHIKDVHLALSILLGMASLEDKQLFLPGSPESLKYCKRLLCALIENFSILQEEEPLTKHQDSLLNLLIALQYSLQETRAVINEKSTSFWD